MALESSFSAAAAAAVQGEEDEHSTDADLHGDFGKT